MGLSRSAIALRIAVLAALMLLVALPAGAHAASTVHVRVIQVLDINDVLVDVHQVTADGDAADNVVTVTVAADGLYTVSDTTGATAGTGCTQGAALNTVTCQTAPTDVSESVVNGGAGVDTITGGAGADSIYGGPGADFLFGGPGSDIIIGDPAGTGGGDDLINTGGGGIPGNEVTPVSDPYRECDLLPADPTQDRVTWCNDDVTGGQGFDTVTYEDRTGPVAVDLGPGSEGTVDDDGTFDGIQGVEKVIGGPASDELVGGLNGDTFEGGPGDDVPDTICGGLGKDTVDYSDKPGPVTVTLGGVLATDPDITASDQGLSLGARQDCRLTIKGGQFNGAPCNSVEGAYTTYASCKDANGVAEMRDDCTPDDGIQGENDCVGEDIENVIGSPFGDDMVGNDPDPIYGQGPRVEPSGENVFTGGGGNDLLDGSLGADIFQGGAGTDAVSYEGRAEAVAITLDGSANDGSARDFNAANNMSDQIMPDVEDLIGGNGNDVLKGDGSANGLLGGPGDDLIQGHGGFDRLGGDAGADTLEGGEGGDAMDGGPDDDHLFGGFGGDSYDGAPGDGSDTADFSDATTPVSVTQNGAADDGSTNEGDNVSPFIESLIGGLDDDRLNANDGDGILQGGGGNDSLNGGGGADLLVGGRCQDQVAPICQDQVGVGDPKGVDTAGYGGHPGPVDVSLATAGGDGVPGENDVIAGDVEGIGGSAFDDVLSGDAKLNFINGGGGNDRISGAENDDFLAGDLGNDTINGDAGADTADGAEGNDTLNGGVGNDTLRGFTGTDILDGGAGSDTMSGGGGVDTASYTTRSGDVTVDTLGAPDDGEKGENDQVRTDVESVRTGSGDDKINVADGAAGAVTCGAGSDTVDADAADEIGSGCEGGGVRQSSACTPTSRTVRMSGSNVTLRMRCAFNARGSVQLRSAGRVKAGKGKARRLNLGKKSFTGKAGKSVTIRLKVSKSARNAIKRKKRLRVQATLAIRRDGAATSRTNRTTLTLRASGK